MKNTMEHDKYIKEHIFWGLITFLWFKNLLFRCIPNYTYEESLIGFLIISICVMAAGITFSWRRYRNYISLFENIAISWGVFVCISYMELYKERIAHTLLALCVVSLIISLKVLLKRIKRQDKRHKIILRRLEKAVALFKRNVAIAALVIMVPIAFSALVYGTVLNSKVDVAKAYGDEHSLKENIEVICDIEPSRWEKLDIQEKLNVCQTIVNCEARYYGLSHEIKVGTADLPEEIMANYRDDIHQITIDVEHLENDYSYYILDSLLHECCHSYQYAQVILYQKLDEKEKNLLLYRDVASYAEEFARYEDGAENIMAYYSQLSEVHARRAGATESLEYIKAVNEYLGIYLDVNVGDFNCLDDYIEYITED